jgi:P4 family phage/plasmid primase-like protien
MRQEPGYVREAEPERKTYSMSATSLLPSGSMDTPSEGNGHGTTEQAKELTEAERVALLESKLPPILVWDKHWYSFQDGAWQKTPRDIYRRAALQTMPEKCRTARKAKDTLDHFEGLHQASNDCFRSAYQLDGDDILINVANGILRLRSDGDALLEAHSQDRYFCMKLPVNYDPKAEATLFKQTLAQALPDFDDQQLFMIWAASVLFPSNKFEVALCAFGPGGTSKSTLANALHAALGSPATQFLTLKEICDDKGYGVPMLRRAMLNVSTELDTVLLENSDNFKRLISGEYFTAREIYGSPFGMSVTCKFLFLTNHLPRFKFGTDAEIRRLRFLRFGQVPATVDTLLKDKIVSERNGIFALLIEHLRILLREPTIPLGGPNSQKIVKRFSETNDPLGSFVNKRCILDPEDFTAKRTLEDEYNRYLEEIGLPRIVSETSASNSTTDSPECWAGEYELGVTEYNPSLE